MNQYLSLSDLQPFFDNAKADDNITEAWRTQYFENLGRIVIPALMTFFKALKAEGRMVPIPNSKGYASRFWDAWNNVAQLSLETAAKEDADKKLATLADVFAHHMTHRIVWPYERTLKDAGPAAAAAFDKNVAFAEVIGTFSKGTYAPYEFSHETCQTTGLPLCLGFEDWVPQGCYVDVKKGGFVPIEPLAPPTIQETVLELKTGNLLVSDWFRIKEFTAVTREKHISLESRKGIEESARYLATQFGVVSVFVSNTSPDVYQAGNQLVVGNYYEEDGGEVPARLTKVGSVCTDLWAATFVEYETLVELVARSQPETAKQTVDAYLEEHQCDSSDAYGLHRISVEPGTYYLYHFGDFEDFPEMAKKAGINLDTGALTPFFVLSKTRLLTDRAAQA
ncbi:hypothetical protein WJ96_06050 [Burkholderia ubonensis]|uniref:Uncharacterized protein n=1 Tax=Burkholderia ubonensis TaxID=101571 RepID=A0AAW3MYS9_9BURK|nr:hypothetical protein WJ96_06050 [Burkholderia ubonensis]